MEPGRFQEFVLRVLPLYDQKYLGMVRHGGTEFGKTRAGVPDLLKTYGNGDQIGCECGTAEDYWSPPTDSTQLSSWKPIYDARSCIDRLERPVAGRGCTSW